MTDAAVLDEDDSKLRDSIMKTLEDEEGDKELGIVILQEEASECRVRNDADCPPATKECDKQSKRSETRIDTSTEDVQVIVLGEESSGKCSCGKDNCDEDHDKPAAHDQQKGSSAESQSNPCDEDDEEEEEVQVIVMGKEPSPLCSCCGKVDCEKATGGENGSNDKSPSEAEGGNAKTQIQGREKGTAEDGDEAVAPTSAKKRQRSEDNADGKEGGKGDEVDGMDASNSSSKKSKTWDDEFAGDAPKTTAAANGTSSPSANSSTNKNKKQPYKVKMSIHQRWNNFFGRLKAFHQEHGTFQVTGDPSLERWVNRQKSTYHRGQLKPKRLQAMHEIGFDFGQPPKHKGDTWITTKPWHERFEQLMEFKAWHGHCKGTVLKDVLKVI